MKEFVDKYIFEIVVFLSIGFFTLIGKLINYFFKSNITDKMNELKKSLEDVRGITNDLKVVTDSTVTNIKNIIEKMGELMSSLDDFTERMDERFKTLEERLNGIEDKLHRHGEDIATIRATHNTIHEHKI